VSFVPPRCPNPTCEQHTRPKPGFFRRRGFYFPACRQEGVPRFRCKTCRRGFSRQTFRYDYRDRRPHDNAILFSLLTGGMGLRQAGRVLVMDVRAVQQKARKMAAMCSQLHENLCPRLPANRGWLLDEEETYEGASIRPLTMPVLIEKETWFVVATAVGTIRRLAPVGSARRVRQDRDERRGIRPDQSRQCVLEMMTSFARKVPDGNVLLLTDQKASYTKIAYEVFGERVVHKTTAGTLARDTHNPLFPINTTLAMTRDNCGRLRRRSWLVTKKAEGLRNHLHLFTAYRNYVRRRFNRDSKEETPARILGLLPRHLDRNEVLAWRQDWGDHSIHPMSSLGTHTVRDAMRA
jgi:transposase-like protein